jgi:MFS family permease
MAGTTLPTPMYGLYATTIGFTVLTTTVIYGMYAGGVLAALVVFGRWSDAIGRRPVLLGGVVLAIASAATFLIADTVLGLVAARVLSGLSAGLFTGTATAVVVEAAPPKWHTRAAAIATIANMGGLWAGPLLAGVLVQFCPGPLHLAFVVHIAAAALAGFAVLAVPETSNKTGYLGLQRLRPRLAMELGCAALVLGMITLTRPWSPPHSLDSSAQPSFRVWDRAAPSAAALPPSSRSRHPIGAPKSAQRYSWSPTSPSHYLSLAKVWRRRTGGCGALVSASLSPSA